MKEPTIRALLLAHRGRHLRGSASFAILETLLREHHPTWGGPRAALLEGICPMIRRRDGALILRVRTTARRNWFTLSWRACATRRTRPVSAMPVETTELHAAMRTAITSQIRRWRRGRVPRCAGCGQTGGRLQVDHHDPPFRSIRDAFLATVDDTVPTRFGHGKFNAPAFLPADDALNRRWQQFHAAQATYQFLCKPCNLRKGATAPDDVGDGAAAHAEPRLPPGPAEPGAAAPAVGLPADDPDVPVADLPDAPDVGVASV